MDGKTMKQRAGSPRAGPSGGGRGAAALGFLFLGIFLLLQVSPVLNPVTYDESNLVYDGARLSQGEIPYRDFFNFVPPATFCLMAGVHPILPDRPETAERYLVVTLVFLTGLAWFLALEQPGRKRYEALASAAFFLVCLYPFSPFAPHHWFALAFLIPAIALGQILSRRRESVRAWFLPGLAAGLALCTLQTAGFFACAFIAVLILSSRDGRQVAVLRVLWSVLGWAAGLLLCLGPLFLAGAGRSLWRDLVAWPMANYHRSGNPNDVAFLSDLPERLAHLWTFTGPGGPAASFVRAISGSVLYVGILVAALACLVASICTFVRFLRRRRPEPPVLATATLTVLVFGVFARSNPTWVHLVYGLPAVLFAWLCALASSTGRPLRRARVTAAVLVILVSGLVYRIGLLSAAPPTPRQLTDVDRVDRDSPLNRSLRAWSYLKPGDKIVVIPTGGNVYLYTYPAAIGYTYFFPLQDHYNDMEDHRIVARQIERCKPKAILIHKVSYQDFLAREDPVSRLLKSRYRKEGETPALIILARKGSDDVREGSPDDAHAGQGRPDLLGGTHNE
jgi:hypothetical protein